MLLEGVGIIPSVAERRASSAGRPVSATRVPTRNEGWALKQTEKLYRLSSDHSAYLVGKFNVGQETGQKIDLQIAAKEMRRAKDSNGERFTLLLSF